MHILQHRPVPLPWHKNESLWIRFDNQSCTIQYQPSDSFLLLLVFLLALDFSDGSKPERGFCSSLLLGMKLSVESKSNKIFSYIMAASRVYIRRAREEIVEIFAAAESDDQYHQPFLKYSALIMSSNMIVA